MALVHPIAWGITQDSRPLRKLGDKCFPISNIKVHPKSKSRQATAATNMLVAFWRKWKRNTAVMTTALPNTIMKTSIKDASTTPHCISTFVSMEVLEVKLCITSVVCVCGVDIAGPKTTIHIYIYNIKPNICIWHQIRLYQNIIVKCIIKERLYTFLKKHIYLKQVFCLRNRTLCCIQKKTVDSPYLRKYQNFGIVVILDLAE